MDLPKKIHFIGIGGVGMSGLAGILADLGYQVSGSDLCAGVEVQRLQKKGVKCFLGHKAEQIAGAEAVVCSSAIRESNPERQAAVEQGLPLLHRSQILAFLMEHQKGLAVAGAHGKTTTSSMLALVLTANNYDPSITVGGEVPFLAGNAHWGQGEYLVAESDESDGSFLNLSPWSVLITNVEDDHLDHYGTVEKIREAFAQFINSIPAEGVAVLGMDSLGLQTIIENGLKSKTRLYSLHNPQADYYLQNISFERNYSQAEVYEHGKLLGQLKLQVPGEHNLANALGVIALCRFLGLEFEAIAAPLAEFTGAGRRFELLGEISRVRIIDDYGHHPTEIEATLTAAARTCQGRLICIFQPHRYTRTQLLANRFGRCFKAADQLIINEIYAAGETPIAGVTANLIVQAVEEQDPREVLYWVKMEDIVDYLAEQVQPEDLVLFMGAGNIRQAGIKLVERLQKDGIK
ncbi:MAG: UDP-N-acetylmuramate--L-alanine ligase [Clostridia bacterium]|nr:UDP-N-acetylmuramate--L-alanine ligase [Clostridia bacterium]